MNVVNPDVTIPHATLNEAGRACLRELAARYVWWKTPDEAMQYPQRVAAQVMNIGAWEDVVRMNDAIGEDYLRFVLTTAEAGQLDERSWHYWHYRLGLAEYGKRPVPPLPKIGNGSSIHSKFADLRRFIQEFVQNPPADTLTGLASENALDQQLISSLNNRSAGGSRAAAVVSWLNQYSAWQSFSSDCRQVVANQIVEYFDGPRTSGPLDSADRIVSEFRKLEGRIQILAKKRKAGSPRDVTSLTSKALWICYPEDVPMFDGYASRGLQVLARLYGLTTSRNECRYAAFVDVWRQVFCEFRDIFSQAHQSRPDLWPFRSRVLDRVLWRLGEPVFDLPES